MKSKIIPWFIVSVCGLLAILFIWQSSLQTQIYVQELNNQIAESYIAFNQAAILHEVAPPRAKPEKIEAKGIYLTAYSAGSQKTVDRMIALIDQTELNAVVIDIKDYSGYILYDSDVELVNEMGVEDNRLRDITATIEKFHEHGIYVIARQTVFQDPALARNRPDWAIHNHSGGLWYDNMGLSWVDPSNEHVWEYNVAIAKEAASFGFDEVNFDYVRFPSDGNMRAIAYTNGERKLYEVMGDFFSYLDEELQDEPIHISLDMFGFVMERHDGISIGQRLEDAVDHVDYICPMMYPSHYPPGHLNLANPAAYPGAVIENGMRKGAPYFEGHRAEARPWIQAFHIGAYYDGAKIREQIDQVEAYSDGGWLLWNASNNYTSAGLKLQ
ncbi:putative glycoside hydrolase [Patescibacteria group bacterium]|nr:putative glycoside hydrolase [Patescibacteria group bacterium]MBU1721668.1 putative glycoside hydrolase [Patescibacteria group bacterium]MBU1900977.1 putative glycoside hydrolase [Patescibacteria group bacterium]